MVFAILCCIDVHALAPDFDKRGTIDSLETELSRCSSQVDSMVILSGLFDLYPRTSRDSIGRILFGVAVRSDNSDFGLDIVRNLGNLHLRNDSLLDKYILDAKEFEPSVDREETITFLRMLRNSAKVRHAGEEEKDREFHRIMRRLNSSQPQDIYDQIVSLHAMCLYIADGSQGELLSKYLDKLGTMVDKLRPEAYSLRNCYYVQAALAYANNSEYEKSVHYDRLLLENIDAMEEGSVGRGRKYRDYDGNRYVLYTRLLANFPLLNSQEVEEYYSKAMRLVEEDELAGSTNAVSGLPQIYYSMYHKDYSHALELLKQYRDMPYNASKKEKLLKYTIECAEALDDKEALLEASREYNDVLEEVLNRRSREKYKELELVYDINETRAALAENSRIIARRAFVGAIVAASILLVLLIVVFLLFRHTRRLAANLRISNEALRRESDNLKESQAELTKARDEAQTASRFKSDFIKNMSSEVAVPLHTINEYTNLIIDCSEAGYNPYLKHFSELIAINSEMLTTIMNDLLNLSEIDSKTLVVKKGRENLESLLEMAAGSVRHRVHSGVKLVVEKTGEEVSVTTDAHRLVQILVQLLKNAAKVTTEGEIKVSYSIDIDQRLMHIFVSDTGPGVSPENSEKIFGRFVKLDRTSQGAGIGLPIARHLAELMGGTLTVDTGYAGGARFELTLPMD